VLPFVAGAMFDYSKLSSTVNSSNKDKEVCWLYLNVPIRLVH